MNYFLFYFIYFFHIVLNWPHDQRCQNADHCQHQMASVGQDVSRPLHALAKWARP
jgi:hypothetical protein